MANKWKTIRQEVMLNRLLNEQAVVKAEQPNNKGLIEAFEKVIKHYEEIVNA